MKPKNQYCYRAWLLRYWIEPGSNEVDQGAMRFSLEDPRTGHRKGFANLESFVEFLRTELKNRKGQDQSNRSPPLNGDEEEESSRINEQE